MTGEASGPSHRLTAEQEERAAEHFARGASERQVAEALGVGAGTAHRLRDRLAGRIAELAALAAGSEETTVGTDDDMRDEIDNITRGELLAQLGVKREELAGQLADLEARAAASGQAIAALDAERRLLLADGKDAAQLRPRVASARDDLADWQTSAEIARQQVALVDQRIAEVNAEQELADMRALLAPAVAERDAAIRSTGDRMAAAVLAVKAAAIEFAAALADETAARDRTELLAAQIAGLAGSLGQPGSVVPAEPESTIPPVRGDANGGGELALVRAMGAARLNHPEMVAQHLGEVFGWLPPTRAEQAAEMERWRQVRAEQDRQMLQARQQSQPWTREGGEASIPLDANGQEMRTFIDRDGRRAGYIPHPHDAWYPALGATYNGGT